ncbi:MAG: hypothetical protein KJZ70_03850 [Bryobacterales bacterium]|nr:hypothetical protein [Bryobacterales bacterium]
MRPVLRVFLPALLAALILPAQTSPTPPNASASPSLQRAASGIARETRPMEAPRAGAVETFPLSQLKPGMQATAWTVFLGNDAEPVPIEIIGLWKNAWGPRQDIILGKMGGKAAETNVAGGMSGSPVYIDGKLVGAVSLRLSVFSPDAICGITPIEQMLEINEFDDTLPPGAKVPEKAVNTASVKLPDGLARQVMAAGSQLSSPLAGAQLTPIETPLAFSGFTDDTLDTFGPMLRQMGLQPVRGGAGAAMNTAKPAAGWEDSLRPGAPVAGVLVSGDMSITGLGTVTYNDGKRVLAFGHPFFNLGPVSMPMAKGEVLMVLSSKFQPNKIANATEVVGALRQDRHSGIMGVLGESAEMVPVAVKVRSFDEKNQLRKEKDLGFQVFVHQKWTPVLMMMTLFNSINGLNDFMDDATYRFQGSIEFENNQKIELSTIRPQEDLPMPAHLMLAGWWADKFNQLFQNSVNAPRVRSVDMTVDLLPERRIAAIENAWMDKSEVQPGDTVNVKVFLRPYRGKRLERSFVVKIPAQIPAGEHRLLLSDADTLNRQQTLVRNANKHLDLNRTVSLLNQERSNNKLYVSLVQSSPSIYKEDKVMPRLPASVLNAINPTKDAGRSTVNLSQTIEQMAAIPFDYMIDGSLALRLQVD